MRRPRPATPLKLAIVAKGVVQKELAAELGIHETKLSQIVHGYYAHDDLRQRIAKALDRTVEELWPSRDIAA